MNPAQPHKAPPSKADLLASAKVIGDAAKATLNHGAGGVDKGKVAGAAANILDAATHYGKLEGKSAGKCAEKAESYLRTYQSSHAAPAAHGQPAPHHGGAAGNAAHAQAPPGTHSQSGGGGGYGDYMKLAQGLLKKH
ncbi:nodulin-related protein 1-like [Wolffia australiana]